MVGPRLSICNMYDLFSVVVPPKSVALIYRVYSPSAKLSAFKVELKKFVVPDLFRLVQF